MIINTAASMITFAVLFGVGLVIYWPDVPWLMLQVLGMAAIFLFHVAFYPMSKTIWLGLDLLMTGMDRSRRQ